MWKFLERIRTEEIESNTRNILSLLQPNPSAAVLDIGCGNGDLTLRFAEKIGSKDISGIELDGIFAEASIAKGIKVSKIDIERAPFPFPDGSFDIIIANQVIEHLTYPDSFLPTFTAV